MTGAHAVPFQSRTSDSSPAPEACGGSTNCRAIPPALWPEASWGRTHCCFSSALFLSFRKFEGHFPHELKELTVLFFQTDEFGKRRLAFGLLRNPAVHSSFVNAVVFCCLRDGDTVILNAVDNLCLQFRRNVLTITHIRSLYTRLLMYQIGVQNLGGGSASYKRNIHKS